jgi:hypothetical protein
MEARLPECLNPLLRRAHNVRVFKGILEAVLAEHEREKDKRQAGTRNDCFRAAPLRDGFEVDCTIPCVISRKIQRATTRCIVRNAAALKTK